MKTGAEPWDSGTRGFTVSCLVQLEQFFRPELKVVTMNRICFLQSLWKIIVIYPFVES